MVVDQICEASGLINRGPKKRTDLAFLNNTEEPAILIETCFVDSQADVDIYYQNYDVICGAIAGAIAGEDSGEPDSPDARAAERCAVRGGRHLLDLWRAQRYRRIPSEGLGILLRIRGRPVAVPRKAAAGHHRASRGAWIRACSMWPAGGTTMSRPRKCSRDSGQMALVTNKKTGVSRLAHPADWGPHEAETGRAADLSPGLAESLGVTTDDEVTVVYPA